MAELRRGVLGECLGRRLCLRTWSNAYFSAIASELYFILLQFRSLKLGFPNTRSLSYSLSNYIEGFGGFAGNVQTLNSCILITDYALCSFVWQSLDEFEIGESGLWHGSSIKNNFVNVNELSKKGTKKCFQLVQMFKQGTQICCQRQFRMYLSREFSCPMQWLRT